MYQLKPINSTQHGVFFAGVFLREAGELEREVEIITRANMLFEQQYPDMLDRERRKAASARNLKIAGNLAKANQPQTTKMIVAANKARKELESNHVRDISKSK